jgi:hypothetical protein
MNAYGDTAERLRSKELNKERDDTSEKRNKRERDTKN